MKSNLQKIELLAPARDADVAIAAVDHGADAVYIGAAKFGARSSAGNSVDDIARVVSYAHKFNVKVYATVNTVIYDNELKEVESLIGELYNAGVDALIVQDMGVLRLDIPPVALHASTQCDIRTPEKAKFLESLGFSQLVLARELTLDEIRSVHEAVGVPLEAFVHGALCVSYSGRCDVSQVLKCRSANRGECAQICRLAYDLEDAAGNKLLTNKHLLSLKDFNMSSRLEAMMEAGVSSFKIEGRLKDIDYVKNVVAYYRKAIDRIISSHTDKYVRSSVGKSTFTFEPQLDRSFNRSFTDYFTSRRRPDNGHSMASIDTPKSMGEYLGRVTSIKGVSLRLDTDRLLANGDGLSYFDNSGNYTGVRVNRVDGNDILLKDRVDIPVGAAVFRTFDKKFTDALSRPSATRKIEVDAELKLVGDDLVLSLVDERGNSVVHAVSVGSVDDAKSSQEQRQLAELGKLGNTVYVLRNASVLSDKFIPSSFLSRLRRETVELLDKAQLLTYERSCRKAESATSPCFSTHLTYADNVANDLAASLYRSHGVKVIEPAIECWGNRDTADVVVMNTRYCIRRELGACRMVKGAKQLPDKLFLRNGNTLLAVDCDCKRCEMKISVVNKG
jgi:collagenase-like PrtC family protease